MCIKNKYVKQIFTGIGKFIIAVLIFLLIFGIIIPGLLSLFWGKDIPEVDDADLMLPKVTLAYEQNMFIELDQISRDMIYEPKEVNFVSDFLNSDTWDEEFANEVFTKNEQALELWDRAAQKDEFLLPDMADLENKTRLNLPINDYNRWRGANRVSLAYAVWLAHTGRNQAAVDQVLKSLKIGEAMMKSQMITIGYLVGMAIKNNSLDGLQKVFAIGEGENIDKDGLLYDLVKYNNQNENVSYLKFDYILTKKDFIYLKNNQENYFGKNHFIKKYIFKNNFYYKPNLTISYQTDLYRQLIKNTQDPCGENEVVESIFRPYNTVGYLKLYFTENAVGKVLTNLYFMPFNNVIKKTCDLQNKYQGTYNLIENY